MKKDDIEAIDSLIGILVMLGILIGMKLKGLITCSWLVALSPLWIFAINFFIYARIADAYYENIRKARERFHQRLYGGCTEQNELTDDGKWKWTKEGLETLMWGNAFILLLLACIADWYVDSRKAGNKQPSLDIPQVATVCSEDDISKCHIRYRVWDIQQGYYEYDTQDGIYGVEYDLKLSTGNNNYLIE